MIKKILKSVRAKLFLTLCVVIVMIIGFFVVINNAVLEALYYYNKKEIILDTYEFINTSIQKEFNEEEKNRYELELEKVSVNNNFEILILNKDNNEDIIYATNKNFLPDFGTINEIKYDVNYSIFNKSDVMYAKDGIDIRRLNDRKNGIVYVLLSGTLDNGNKLYIRMPITPIQDSASISNRFIFVMGTAAIILGGVAITFITQRFTKPIEELNDIANEINYSFAKMAAIPLRAFSIITLPIVWLVKLITAAAEKIRSAGGRRSGSGNLAVGCAAGRTALTQIKNPP